MNNCKYCNKENNTIWSKCDNCLKGITIFSNGIKCFICKEKRIPIEDAYWKAYCNKCFCIHKDFTHLE